MSFNFWYSFYNHMVCWGWWHVKNCPCLCSALRLLLKDWEAFRTLQTSCTGQYCVWSFHYKYIFVSFCHWRTGVLRIEVIYYCFRKLCLRFWKRNWTKKYPKKKMGQLQSTSLHCRKFILLVMENLSGKVKYYIWSVWIFRFYLKCSMVAVTLKNL